MIITLYILGIVHRFNHLFKVAWLIYYEITQSLGTLFIRRCVTVWNSFFKLIWFGVHMLSENLASQSIALCFQFMMIRRWYGKGISNSDVLRLEMPSISNRSSNCDKWWSLVTSHKLHLCDSIACTIALTINDSSRRNSLSGAAKMQQLSPLHSTDICKYFATIQVWCAIYFLRHERH